MKLLVDSDFLVAAYKADDPSHIRATKMSRLHNKQGNKFVCLNLVVQESATVISHRMGMDDARKFYKNIGNFIDTFIVLDTELEKECWNIFLEQSKKGTSFVDCANLAVCQKYKLDGILSFDKFYPKEVVVK